jgi:hypothetical protein
MNYRISRGKIFKWIVLAVTALLAMRLFFVQQLIAAFLIFSVLFACIAAVLLILFVVDHAVQIAFAQAGAYMRTFSHAARRGWEPAEGGAAWRSFQFDRLAAQPLARATNHTGGGGRRTNQGTDIAYVPGDLTSPSTKVAGTVRAVNVSHFQQVRKGDGHPHNAAC